MSVSSLSSDMVHLLTECSRGKLELKPSPHGGVGVFALVDFSPGDLLFHVPRKLILSSCSPVVLQHPDIQALAQNQEITAETLLFTYMILARKEGRNDYIKTLSSIAQLDKSELCGTNVGVQIASDEEEVNSQALLIQARFPEMTVEQFKWAKLHYNGRRYPSRFSLQQLSGRTSGHSSGLAGGSTDTNTDTNTDSTASVSVSVSPSKKRKMATEPTDHQHQPEKEGESSTAYPLKDQDQDQDKDSKRDSRRVYDPTQGSLVPLLDSLNHSATHPAPLLFDVEDEHLLVKTAVAYKTGEEVYSNYGCSSNDALLLQFGFCDLHNEDMDCIAVKLLGGGGGLQELRPGGIPESLLQDGGEGLYYFLKKKKKSLPTNDEAASFENPFVTYYIDRQRKVLKLLIKELDAMSY